MKKKLPTTRQFLITEGIFVNTGQLCDLPALVQLKKKYKYRLIVDESISLGSLGPHGKGISDHYNLDTSLIDILTASMSNAIGSNGGFCAGSKQISEHQRLSGQAYTFSASLPAMLTVAAIEAFSYIENNPDSISLLLENSKLMHEQFKTGLEHTGMYSTGSLESPICHLMLKKPQETRQAEEIILQEIVDQVKLN